MEEHVGIMNHLHFSLYHFTSLEKQTNKKGQNSSSFFFKSRTPLDKLLFT
jgi:hypothetical protein